MKLMENLKVRSRILKKEITAIYYAYQNPKTKPLPKIIILFALGYSLSPIDLIPDFIPILGYLDDLILVPALIALSIKLIPKEIMDEAREKAAKEPVTLRKNLFFAIFFVLIWLMLLTIIVLSVMRFFAK